MTIKNDDFSLKAATIAVFLCIIFGSNAVALKISLTGLGVFTSAGLRVSIAAFGLLLWAFFCKKSLTLEKTKIKELLILSASWGLHFMLFYLGVSKTKASHASLLLNVEPFFILLLAHYFIVGDRITKRKFFGFFFGFIGVIFVLIEKGELTFGFNSGDLLILLVAFTAACRIVFLKRIIQTFEILQLTFYQMIFTAPILFAAAFIWDDTKIIQISAKVMGALLYQGLIITSFGFMAWYYLLHRYSATKLHSFLYIMPLSGVCLARFMLNETFTLNILMAIMFIFIGIFIVNFRANNLGVALLRHTKSHLKTMR